MIELEPNLNESQFTLNICKQLFSVSFSMHTHSSMKGTDLTWETLRQW